MNKGILRVVMGAVFIGLGSYQLMYDASSNRILSIIIAIYGVGSLGYGLYLVSRKRIQQEEEE